jgi:hypothetical protein
MQAKQARSLALGHVDWWVKLECGDDHVRLNKHGMRRADHFTHRFMFNFQAHIGGRRYACALHLPYTVAQIATLRVCPWYHRRWSSAIGLYKYFLCSKTSKMHTTTTKEPATVINHS